mmetsp:Transcript_5901/g.10139  ORF Transcript_5901/g.10139 Transcript_5901/m.10139 type:complete len:425 (+) Transcript_5901:129-1403(+)
MTMSPFRLFTKVFFFTMIVALFTTQFQLISQSKHMILLEGDMKVNGIFPQKMPAPNTNTNDARHTKQQNQQRPFVDILSIASRARPEVAQAQKDTWASHRIVRHFFTVTEDDDPDPFCSQDITDAQIMTYSKTCRSRDHWPVRNTLTKYFTQSFARSQWLVKKKDPGAWLCAQRRMAAGLAKIGRAYRNAAAEEMPDFLFLVDDDTYVNMDRFEKEILLFNNNTEGEVIDDETDRSAKVYVGCLVFAPPAKLIQFSFPFGGWGTFFSRGAIERLIMPLHCSTKKDSANRSPFEEGACRRLNSVDDYHLQESPFFNEGMSISDLMAAFAGVTTSPYCMHSDWGIGYFINFYNISGVRWEGPGHWYPQVAQTRIHPLGRQASYIYRNPGGECRLTGENCNTGSLVCHYVNTTQMKGLWRDRQVSKQ